MSVHFELQLPENFFVISNVNLHKRCKTEPLSTRVERNIKKILGHDSCVRSLVDGPDYTSPLNSN